jgi:predicted Zn finger-like uncharacterized protein
VFTQCPECGTVFRVTATVLRAAQGQVRCGVCDANFDALRFLTDSVDHPPPTPPGGDAAPPGPPAAGPPPAPRATATRTTPSEDEGRALAQIAAALARDPRASASRGATPAAPAQSDRPSAPTPRPPPPEPEDEVNVLEPVDVEDIVLSGEVLGGEEIPDTALEFDAPAAEWDRVFVAESAPRARAPLDINLSGFEAAAGADDEARATDSHSFVLVDEPAPAPAPAIDSGDLKLVEEDPLSRTDEYAALDAAAAAAEPGGIEEAWFEPSHPAAAARAPVAPPFEPALAAPRVSGARRRQAFAAGAALLGLALLAQLLQLAHRNREELAANSLVGRAVSALYARLGLPIEPRWDLGAYDVKQWGAATDAAPGALRLRASVVNKADRPQPFPLLRVTLEDRFGSKIARGEFTPAEYLPGREAPAGMLAAGARADADLMLDDPGSQAVGFELDVCLKRAGALVCGSEQKASGSG